MEFAISANVLFLGIVATWRVALYIQFLRNVGKLSFEKTIVMSLLPLVGIMFALMALNLENAVFEIMAGLETERTDTELIHDNVYGFVFFLGVLSIIAAPIVLLLYLGLCFQQWLRRRKENQEN